ncbi:hypothetical protein HPB50_019744 [Hyalomma asiaticum]|uniref:Uncharacterized protein n=1 Tax=Hyalomma asiaticum TaxID=266040 RepID=A0ACB7TN94_HYAAI|nr:hypothetical protein HPB50_019744 [Hyalomma asiaticum]
MASHPKSVVGFSEASSSMTNNGASAGAYNRHGPGGSFLRESFHSSADIPTSIAWHTLSSDLSEDMRQGSHSSSSTTLMDVWIERPQTSDTRLRSAPTGHGYSSVRTTRSSSSGFSL